MASLFQDETFTNKLKALTETSESIQTTSTWVQFQRKKVESVVQVWSRELFLEPPPRKLLYFYLANDVLQSSRRKGTEFINGFESVLPAVIEHISSSCDDGIIKKIKRTLSIWQDRQLYTDVFVKQLNSILDNSASMKNTNTKDSPSQTSMQEDSPLVSNIMNQFKQLKEIKDSSMSIERKLNQAIKSPLFQFNNDQISAMSVDTLTSHIKEGIEIKLLFDNNIQQIDREINIRNEIITSLKNLLEEQENAIIQLNDSVSEEDMKLNQLNNILGMISSAVEIKRFPSANEDGNGERNVGKRSYEEGELDEGRAVKKTRVDGEYGDSNPEEISLF